MDRVLIAQIGAAHGVRGEVRLKAFTEDPMSVARYGALETERNVLVYVRVPYDVETAARKIQQAGLPPVLGLRLLEGM